MACPLRGALHPIAGLVSLRFQSWAPRRADSQTDGLLLNVSLPLPTPPCPTERRSARGGDETWETAVGVLSYYVEGCIDHG